MSINPDFVNVCVKYGIELSLRTMNVCGLWTCYLCSWYFGEPTVCNVGRNPTESLTRKPLSMVARVMGYHICFCPWVLSFAQFFPIPAEDVALYVVTCRKICIGTCYELLWCGGETRTTFRAGSYLWGDSRVIAERGQTHENYII